MNLGNPSLRIFASFFQAVFFLQCLYIPASNAEGIVNKKHVYEKASLEISKAQYRSLEGSHEYEIEYEGISLHLKLLPGDSSTFAIDGKLVSIDSELSDFENTFHIAEFLQNHHAHKFSQNSAKAHSTGVAILDSLLEIVFPTAHAGWGLLVVAAVVVAAVVLIVKKNKDDKKESKAQAKAAKIDAKYNGPKGTAYQKEKAQGFASKVPVAEGAKERTYNGGNRTGQELCYNYWYTLHDWHKKGHNVQGAPPEGC